MKISLIKTGSKLIKEYNSTEEFLAKGKKPSLLNQELADKMIGTRQLEDYLRTFVCKTCTECNFNFHTKLNKMKKEILKGNVIDSYVKVLLLNIAPVIHSVFKRDLERWKNLLEESFSEYQSNYNLSV